MFYLEFGVPVLKFLCSQTYYFSTKSSEVSITGKSSSFRGGGGGDILFIKNNNTYLSHETIIISPLSLLSVTNGRRGDGEPFAPEGPAQARIAGRRTALFRWVRRGSRGETPRPPVADQRL